MPPDQFGSFILTPMPCPGPCPANGCEAAITADDAACSAGAWPARERMSAETPNRILPASISRSFISGNIEQCRGLEDALCKSRMREFRALAFSLNGEPIFRPSELNASVTTVSKPRSASNLLTRVYTDVIIGGGEIQKGSYACCGPS